MPDLSSYIRNLLKKGYSVDSIKQQLIKYGYPEKAVDQAIYNINRGEKKGFHFSMKLFLMIVIIIVVIAAGLFAYSAFFPAEEEFNLDANLGSVESEVNAGSSLSFTLSFPESNIGEIASARYIIEESGERISTKGDSFTIRSLVTKEVDVPSKAGSYDLRIEIRSRGQTQELRKSFSVQSKTNPVMASCFDQIRNQGEEDVDCGGPCKACEDDTPVQPVQNDVCGDGKCTGNEDSNNCIQDCPISQSINVWDELERIKNNAESDPYTASNDCQKLSGTYGDKCLQTVGEIANDEQICSKIDDSYYADKCFSNVAKNKGSAVICEQIQKESRRDNCYINFAIDGDYSVCDKIVNSYLKQSCTTLEITG